MCWRRDSSKTCRLVLSTIRGHIIIVADDFYKFTNEVQNIAIFPLIYIDDFDYFYISSGVSGRPAGSKLSLKEKQKLLLLFGCFKFDLLGDILIGA